MKFVVEPPDEAPNHPTSEAHEFVFKFKKHEDNQDVMPKIDNEVTMEGKGYTPAASAQEINSENSLSSMDVGNDVSRDESHIDAQFPDAPLDHLVDEARIVDREPPDEAPCHPTSATNEIVFKVKNHEDNQDVIPKTDNEVTLKGKDYAPASAQEINSENLVPSMDVENAALTYDSQIDAQFPEAPLDSLVDEARLANRETEVFADKRPITEITDGDSQIVKDICIDESSRYLIKRLVEEIDANEMVSPGAESSTTSANGYLSGLYKVGASVQHGLDCKSVITNNENHESSWSLPDVVNEPSTGDQTNIDISHQKITLQQLFLLGESDSGFDGSVTTANKLSSDDQHISYQKKVKEVTLDELRSTGTESNITTETIENSGVERLTDEKPEVNLESECYISTTVTSDVTVLNQGRTEKDFDITNLEVIKPELKSGAEKSSGSEENTDSPQIAPAQTEETVQGDPKASARKLLYQDNHTDMNLSGPYHLPGPKVSSGHIAYSGNTSMRSDSSTTSTRSFAFPILQSEWNTSPVKMAKAKRRHFMKCQWLRRRLLCCKF